jgi:hypothetical protein
MLQVIKQTRSEKVKMYMKLPKKKLAEMLVNCNEILDGCAPRLDVVELKKLCDEYDNEYGNYPESQYEGKHLYEFALERISKSKMKQADSMTSISQKYIHCDCGKVYTVPIDTI